MLVTADRMLGFDWYDMMVGMAITPYLNEVFFRVYNMVLPQIALLLVALAWNGHAEKVYRYCLAIAVGALIAIFDLGDWSRRWAPNRSTRCRRMSRARLTLSVTTDYGKRAGGAAAQRARLHHASDVRGLIAFPSYHGVLALIVTLYALAVFAGCAGRSWLINAVVLISTPIQGGHHLVDVLAAFPVAALSIFIASLGAKTQSAAILPAW